MKSIGERAGVLAKPMLAVRPYSVTAMASHSAVVRGRRNRVAQQFGDDELLTTGEGSHRGLRQLRSEQRTHLNQRRVPDAVPTEVIERVKSSKSISATHM